MEAAIEMANLYDYAMTTIDGDEKSLRDYQGKVVLIVNVASKCGLTPQYEGLQRLYDNYCSQGLEVLGFPCNQFAGQEPGTEAMKQMMSMFFTAFPDMHSHVDFMVAEGDIVAGRMTTTGTNQGDFMGIPATGKKITMTETHIVRIANGKAVEHWGNADELGMMHQLGVIPSE